MLCDRWSGGIPCSTCNLINTNQLLGSQSLLFVPACLHSYTPSFLGAALVLSPFFPSSFSSCSDPYATPYLLPSVGTARTGLLWWKSGVCVCGFISFHSFPSFGPRHKSILSFVCVPVSQEAHTYLAVVPATSIVARNLLHNPFNFVYLEPSSSCTTIILHCALGACIRFTRITLAYIRPPAFVYAFLCHPRVQSILTDWMPQLASGSHHLTPSCTFVTSCLKPFRLRHTSTRLCLVQTFNPVPYLVPALVSSNPTIVKSMDGP
ncbi:hypothetical protein F5B22DRAFT_360430 [Xylaria bambusicola]|uniref:uncharacterized protein n=1 Tax=Xylaria bambusicola TaxID=326684 RepID=UPI0020087C0C|nr:uncharacterized protein F5B22DRAFT_360430 [Xylaria bambusicola]KAI0509320.1 hypothetical protein F5B22DRAFT_360430 [Xylaria bambusicola]